MFKNRPRLLFYSLLCLFAIPVIGAWYAYQHPERWISHTTNHGTLIKPLLKISDFSLQNDQSKPANLASFNGHWVMIYVNPNTCNDACKKLIYQLQQIHKATGKYQDKVASMYVGFDGKTNQELALQYSLTQMLLSNNEALAHFLNNPTWLKQISKQGQVFLMDPHGYVMMRYDTQQDPEDIYKDLMHLLALN